MAVIRNKLAIEIEPTVPEICEVISAVITFYPGQEVRILEGIKKSLDDRLQELKEEEKDEGS